MQSYSRLAAGVQHLRKRAFAWLAAGLLCLGIAAKAQVVPAGYHARQALWVGGEYSNFSPDFPNGSSLRMGGVGAYARFDWTARVGIEGEIRFLRFGSYHGENETSYLAGPRFAVFHRGRLHPYIKFLAGSSQMQFPFSIGSGNYFTMAPGGGLDYQLSRRLSLRADYEYQLWPRFPGLIGVPNNGLTPNGFTAGVAYRVFHR